MTNNIDFDFGFTAVDENELETVQQLSQQTQQNSQNVQQLETKINKLYNAIQPLLTNLKKNPEKEYIYWPKRTAKIDQFEDTLRKIIEG